jgi:hypothetical protein
VCTVSTRYFRSLVPVCTLNVQSFTLMCTYVHRTPPGQRATELCLVNFYLELRRAGKYVQYNLHATTWWYRAGFSKTRTRRCHVRLVHPLPADVSNNAPIYSSFLHHLGHRNTHHHTKPCRIGLKVSQTLALRGSHGGELFVWLIAVCGALFWCSVLVTLGWSLSPWSAIPHFCLFRYVSPGVPYCSCILDYDRL